MTTVVQAKSKWLVYLTSLLMLFSTSTCSGLGSLLRPSPTARAPITPVGQPTPLEVAVYTRTPTDTATLPPSPTHSATPLPTETITPSPTATATIDALGCLPAGEAAYGMVRWVSDGDTIVVEIDGSLYSVHYLGIDTPAYIPDIAYMGPVAIERNNELVVGRSVKLVKDLPDRDRFGQLLRYVILDDGVFVNFELLIEGLARLDPLPAGLACEATFRQAEAIAHAGQIGVWMATPTRPPTFTPFPTTTRTATPTVTQSATSTPTLSGSITPSATNSQTATVTPVASLTATSTLQPTLTTKPTSPPPSPTFTSSIPNVHITDIHFNGTPSENESDEYVVIKNDEQNTVSIYNWTLDSDEQEKEYIFPNFNLVAGQSCRVYTNESHPETCGFNFQSPNPIWNNDSDCAYLYNENGIPIDEYCY
jgi:endonuclease YncB( thermonuclease family)